MLAAQGFFKEAWETILQENPFPAVCGRVCYHPCEKICNRGEFDESVAIHTLERFLADTATRYGIKPELERFPSKPQKVAIVGSGPSGLAAAYFLARLGYTCDVFEAMPEPGGVLRWGIPPYRLPVSVLKNEMEGIQNAGVLIHCNKTISHSFLEEARGQYEAVFLGCGHSKGLRFNIPGEDSEGVADGLSFLLELSQGHIPSFQGPVAIVGGGNTAMDVARSVLRLGGKSLLIYRRRREDMPAFEDEIQMALEEGVELHELRTPVQIEPSGSNYRLTLQAMEVVDVDPQGKARVKPLSQETEVIEVTRIFKAIGLEASQDWYNPPATGQEVLLFSNTVLSHSDGRPVTVFGGDLVADIKSVVHAVASGKEAAMSLDIGFREGFDGLNSKLRSYMVGQGPSLSMEMYMKGPRCQRNLHVVQYGEINTDYFQFSPRVVQPRLLKEERVRSFGEIDLRISANLAIREAERCFNCGLCNECDNCRLFCPDLAVIRKEACPGRSINYDYCKGCGICVVECPRNAMSLEEE
jgi:NADPH-dependent glutamate synthase beta subunit-like oxidoreductase